MKSLLVALSVCLAVAHGDIIPEWVTATGKTFKEVSVVRIQPDGISIRHENGAAKISFDELTTEQRTTYQLTGEGRDRYVAAQREAARQAALDAAAAESRANSLAASSHSQQAVAYVTPEEVKRLWLSRYPVPSRLEKNYLSLIARRKSFFDEVKSGSRNLAAERKAAEYNRELALKAGDDKRVQEENENLERIARQETDIARLRSEEEYRRRQLELLADSLSSPVQEDVSPPVVVVEPSPPAPTCPPPPTESLRDRLDPPTSPGLPNLGGGR